MPAKKKPEITNNGKGKLRVVVYLGIWSRLSTAHICPDELSICIDEGHQHNGIEASVVVIVGAAQ